MSIEKVREYFKEFGIEDKILELNDSSATVLLAAEALGCEPARIAKTLAFKKTWLREWKDMTQTDSKYIQNIDLIKGLVSKIYNEL